MREVVFPTGRKKERASHSPAAATPVVILPPDPIPKASRPSRSPRSPRPLQSPEPRPRTNRRLRDFLVSYDGKFIAHFRAPKPLLPRIAFGQVAREMRSKIPQFAPEKMALHRPVKLHVAKPSAAETSDRGDFTWFEE